MDINQRRFIKDALDQLNELDEGLQQLETTYNRVRQRNLPVPDGLIRITQHAFNKVREVLKGKDAACINNNDALREYIQVAREFRKAIASTGDLADLSGTEVTPDELTTFFLRVSPSITLTEDGNHPLIFMVQDIALPGNSRVLPHKHPSGARSKTL